MTRLIGLADLAGAGLALLGDERLLGPLLLRSRRSRRGGDGVTRRRRGGDGDGRPPPRSARAPRGGEPPRRIGERERPPRTGRFSRRRGERERERDDEEELEEREPDELLPEDDDPELLDELLDEERPLFLLSSDFSAILFSNVF